MRGSATIIAIALFATPAAADKPTPAEVEKIDALLAGMQCEIDDVMCADGQYDIDLDSDMTVTGKKAE